MWFLRELEFRKSRPTALEHRAKHVSRWRYPGPSSQAVIGRAFGPQNPDVERSHRGLRRAHPDSRNSHVIGPEAVPAWEKTDHPRGGGGEGFPIIPLCEKASRSHSSRGVGRIAKSFLLPSREVAARRMRVFNAALSSRSSTPRPRSPDGEGTSQSTG